MRKKDRIPVEMSLRIKLAKINICAEDISERVQKSGAFAERAFLSAAFAKSRMCMYRKSSVYVCVTNAR